MGVSLAAIVGFTAARASAESPAGAQAWESNEAWQIVAEAQIARMIGVAPATIASDALPLIAGVIEGRQNPAERPMPVQVASSTAPEGTVTTAALSSDQAAMPKGVIQSAPIQTRVPHTRPVESPRLPALNSREDICNTLAASAQQHGLPIAFFGNLIYQESGLKPRIVSHVGARGIAQFMPGTARMVGLKNPFNPHEALPASAKFLRTLLRQFGNNYGLAAAAYNAGPGKVSRWLKRRTVLPKETRDYVMTITGERAEHWRSIRGNRFGHRLARRMPCNSMAAFSHINDPVVVERELVRKALMMLPRAHPLDSFQQVASAVPVPVSFISPANAAPSANATPTVDRVATGSIAVTKSEERPDNFKPSAREAAASAAANNASQPTGETVVEKTAGSSTIVAKTAPERAEIAEKIVAPKTAKIATIEPMEKRVSPSAKFAPARPKPGHAAKPVGLKIGRETTHADRYSSKAEMKKDSLWKMAAAVEEKGKDEWAEYYAQQKKHRRSKAGL